MNLVTTDVSYYGVLTDIVELHYLSGNKAFLFEWDLWNVMNIKGGKIYEYGYTCLNFASYY